MASDWEVDCLKWRGRVLTGNGCHWCFDWDDLPIDDTCYEWPCCDVAYGCLPRKLKKWAKQGFPQGRSERLTLRFHRAHVWPKAELRALLPPEAPR